MKKRIKLIMIMGLLLSAILCITSCSGNWAPPYEELDKNGYTVSVKFDANGGLFEGTNDVTVVDVFTAENAANGVYLLSPDNKLREEGAFEISRPKYFLAGWYTHRELRTDASGNALDDYGILVSESGRPQGYTYSNKWDFEKDKFTVESGKVSSSNTPALTLYAAWVPYFNYQVYGETEDGDFEIIETLNAINLDVPSWNSETGKIDMKKFPEKDGFTFDCAYSDESKTQPLTESILGAEAYVDYNTGTTNTENITVYTTWLEGNWFKIYNAKQFYQNSRADGKYILCSDLDFTDTVWAPTLTKTVFNGEIHGNGYKISNISTVQGDNSLTNIGLFGSIGENAVLDNVTFENVSLNIQAGSRKAGATFGLLAGSISENATFNKLSISGTLTLEAQAALPADYNIGLLCGMGNAFDTDISNIQCVAGENADFSLEIDVDGSVSVVRN